MASNAIRTQGTIIAHLLTAPSTYETIGEVISFDGPGGKAAIIDITNLQSTFKEKLPGLPDEGSFSMTINFAGADAGQQALQAARTAQSLIQMKITFVDASTATFSAYVMEFKISGKADSKVEVAVTLEITGAVAWQYATSLDQLRAQAEESAERPSVAPVEGTRKAAAA